MESKLFGIILLTWLWLVAGLPFHPREFIPDEEIKKGSYIKHYTRAFYDNEILRQHRARTRRESLPMKKAGGAATLNLHLNALDRKQAESILGGEKKKPVQSGALNFNI
ncbi:hypothetical protein PV326_008261 [Microctonus aethiopoides]|nr:hypothetical protein PV326_008261 [Microctonus aethiopoides]